MDLINVVVLGASANPARISNRAMGRLRDQGYGVIPVNPKGGEILGIPVRTELRAVSEPVDTITLYVSPEHQSGLIDDLIAMRPRRVIFNPGSENPRIYARLRQAGIHIEEACTLVLLATHQFDDA